MIHATQSSNQVHQRWTKYVQIEQMWVQRLQRIFTKIHTKRDVNFQAANHPSPSLSASAFSSALCSA